MKTIAYNCRFSLRHFPGSSYRINLELTNAVEFDKSCRGIAKGWRSERADWATRYLGRMATRTLTAWLEWHVYVLVDYLLYADLKELWEESLRDLCRRGRAEDGKIFREVLQVMFAGEGNALPRQSMARISTILKCVYWHFVPQEFIKAFLKGASTSQKQGMVLPGYES